MLHEKTHLYRGYRLKERLLYPLIFIGPTAFFLLAFIAYPIIYSIVISFKSVVISSPKTPEWIGLENYRYILADLVFWKSIRITFVYSVSVTFIGFVLGLVSALLLENRRLTNLYISLFLLPITVPPVVAGVMFRLLFNKSYGVIEYLFSVLGVTAPNWIADPAFAPITLIIVGIWGHFSLVAIILLGGLGSVPRELYESAQLDGATYMRRLFSITFPVIRPIMATAVILTLITTLKVYDAAVTLTGGGPGTATRTISYYANIIGFQTYHLGRAAASSLVIFTIIVLATTVLARLLLKKE